MTGERQAPRSSSCPSPDSRGFSKWNGTLNEVTTTLERGFSIYPSGLFTSRRRRGRGPISTRLLATPSQQRAMYTFLLLHSVISPTWCPLACRLFAHRMTANLIPMDYLATAEANRRTRFPRPVKYNMALKGSFSLHHSSPTWNSTSRIIPSTNGCPHMQTVFQLIARAPPSPVTSR